MERISKIIKEKNTFNKNLKIYGVHKNNLQKWPQIKRIRVTTQDVKSMLYIKIFMDII